MNRWQIFPLALLFLATSCKDPSKKQVFLRDSAGFDEVYALKDTYPDSALTLFDSFKDTVDLVEMYRVSPRKYYDYQILEAELDYKNNFLVENGDLVLEAAAYYDTVVPYRRVALGPSETEFMRARAFYYAGVVELQENRSVEALQHYLSALRIMDTLNGELCLVPHRTNNKDYLHFTGLIYNRIGWVFYVNDLWDETQTALERAIDCFHAEGNVLGELPNYSVLGEIMMTKGDRQAAMHYYRIVDSLNGATDSIPPCMDWDCQLNEVLRMYENDEKPAAYQLIYSVLEQDNDSSTLKQLRFHLGRFYYEDHEYDSALAYLGDGMQDFSYQTIASLDMIIKMCNELGYSEKAAYYNEVLAHVSMERIEQMRVGSQLSSLFDNYLNEREDSKRGGRFWLIISVILLVVVLLLIFDYHRYRKRKRIHKSSSEAYERQRIQLEREIEKAQAESMKQEERIKNLESELIKVIARRDVSSMTFMERVKVLEETPIGKRVRLVTEANVKAGVAYPELVLSRSQLTQLVNAVDTVFPKFSSKLIDMYPRLKYSDVVYCCMYILGISEVQAAALTGKTYQAVWMRSGKLHEIFDSKSDLQVVLFDILKKMHIDGMIANN